MNKCVNNIISILAKLNLIPLNYLVIVIVGGFINCAVAIPYSIILNNIVNSKSIIIIVTSLLYFKIVGP